MSNNLNTFDFAIRLEDLIVGCCEGGNTIEELQEELQDTIKNLNPGGSLRKSIEEDE